MVRTSSRWCLNWSFLCQESTLANSCRWGTMCDFQVDVQLQSLWAYANTHMYRYIHIYLNCIQLWLAVSIIIIWKWTTREPPRLRSGSSRQIVTESVFDAVHGVRAGGIVRDDSTVLLCCSTDWRDPHKHKPFLYVFCHFAYWCSKNFRICNSTGPHKTFCGWLLLPMLSVWRGLTLATLWNLMVIAKIKAPWIWNGAWPTNLCVQVVRCALFRSIASPHAGW